MIPVAELPAGTVTFLFSDIEGSTRLWESSPDRMREALVRHDDIVRSTMANHDGYVFATGGDGFAVAFERVRNALAAAVRTQDLLAAEPWSESANLRVRMGLHTGEASERDGDYFGTAVNRAARLMATAHGGQIVCSLATATLADGGVVLRSLGEHRLRDLTVPEQIFQVGGGAFPPLRTVDAVPTNLPTMRTELLGRGDDVTTLAELIDRERLVTFTGVGGVGKTRLALGVAAAVAPSYDDGCWLVDLAPLAEGAHVARAVAAAMGAPVTESAALVDYLVDRRMLVVLDNCEHVIGDVAELAEAILIRAAEIHLLATSREPLGLEGEVVRRVASLAVPNADARTEEALQAAAVRLFLERASAVAEGFVLDDGNVEPVVEICRRLDGIPLALELAAARVRSMPPSELSRRLDERFRLLGGGSRRSLERHRTLLATVSWSYDLLLDVEQVVFRRLAVFPASFTLQAAESVAGRDDAVTDVTDRVLALVDRSLLQFDPHEGRYRMLETLRQFAADRLAESQEVETCRDRHARYFLQLVERQAPGLTGRDYLGAFAILNPEIENLRATAAWAMDLGQWQDLAVLCSSTFIFAVQSTPVDGIAWRQHVIDHPDAVDEDVLIEATSELAYLYGQGVAETEKAMLLAMQADVLAAEAGRVPSPWASVARAHALSMAGRYAEALAESESALLASDGVGDEAAALVALGLLTTALAAVGRSEESVATAQEGLRRGELTGHPIHLGVAVITATSSSLTQISSPDFQRSFELLRRYPQLRDVGGANAMWLDLFTGWSMLGCGKPADALAPLAAAARTADRLNAVHVSDLAIRLLALVFESSGRRTEALVLARYAETNLKAFRLLVPAQSWIDGQMDDAGIATTPSAAEISSRGDMMALVDRTTFAIAQYPSPPMA